MSRTFVVDGTQGLIAHVSKSANVSFHDSAIGSEATSDVDHLTSSDNVLTRPDVEFTEFFKDYFDSPSSSKQQESSPMVPQKGYLQYPEMMDSASDHGYSNHSEESQVEVDYLHQMEFKPVLRRGRGRPSGLKKNAEMKMEKPKKRIRMVDINKTVFTYPQIITMALMNFENEIGTAQMIYAFAKYHFPGISGSKSWTNTLRHALSDYKFFARVENVSNSLRRASYWTFIAVRREELIQQIHKTIDENEYSLEKLKMGNTDDLSSILQGTFVLPYDVMPLNRAVPLVKNKAEEVVQQIPNVHFLHQQYYAPVADPMIRLNYSNQNEPAHQQIQYQPAHQQIQYQPAHQQIQYQPAHQQIQYQPAHQQIQYQPAHQQIQYFQQGYNMQGTSYNQFDYNYFTPNGQHPNHYQETHGVQQDLNYH